MTDTQALAMLALRRVQVRHAIMACLPDGAPNENGDVLSPVALVGGDRACLGRVLRRAIERTWLTLEILLCKDDVGERLWRGSQQTLDAIFSNPCFAQLAETPAPFRRTIWRELHASRKGGPLLHGDVDIEELLRQMTSLTGGSDPRSAQDLEWYALWQMAGELTREGYRELRSLFESRTATGESLLIGLVTTFIPFELELEGNGARADLVASVLPEEHVRWLCEHSEPVEEVLNEVYGGSTNSSQAEVLARVRQGQLFAQQGEYERAVIEFTAAIQSDLTSASLYVHRGDALRLRGEYERAIADYSQAQRLDPNNLLAHLNRGLVHRLTGKPTLAIGDLTEALRLDPQNIVALNGRGAAHSDVGSFDLAIADHTNALRLDSSLAWAYQSRGDAYAGQREYDRAIADYTQALRLNPHFLLAHANRGNAYRLAGDIERAVADYTEALRLDPLNPRMYTSRGDAYRRQGRYPQALADYGEAIRLDPTNPTGYLNRGIAYQLAGDLDRAVASFNQAERFDSANPEVFYQRALAYREKESYEKAIVDLGRVIELNPRDAVAYTNRGTLHTLKRRYDEAVSDFSEAIRLDPTSAQARLERGRVQALRCAFEEALADCADAIRLDPHFVPAMLIRGGVFIRTGEYASAVLEFNRAIKANPRYARAYNDRGVAHSKLDQLDEAIRDFTKSIELSPENPQALANRANAFLLQNRHAEALQDFTAAVVHDTKYASTYSVLRGLVEVARGNYRQALADYAVALAIDPKNRTAWTAQVDARAKLESDFVVAPSVMPAPVTTPTVDESAEVVDLSDALVEEEATVAPRRAAAATHLALPSAAAVTAEQAAFEAEQRRLQELEQQQRLRLLAEKAEEIRKRNELEEAKRQAQAKKQKVTRAKRDPEEEAARRKKYLKYSVIAVGFALIVWTVWPLLWSLVPPTKNPYKEVAAEKFVEEYAKDPIAADDQFADKVIVVRGKLKVVRPLVKKGQAIPPARVYFEVPDQEKIWVECQFDDLDLINDLRADTEYKIAGKVQRFKPGTPITLKQAQVRDSGNAVAARKTRELSSPRASKGSSSNRPAGGFANLHAILSRPSPIAQRRVLFLEPTHPTTDVG